MIYAMKRTTKRVFFFFLFPFSSLFLFCFLIRNISNRRVPLDTDISFFFFSCCFSSPQQTQGTVSPLSDSTGKLAGARVCPDKATITSTQLPGRAPIYASNKFKRRKKEKKKEILVASSYLAPTMEKETEHTHTIFINK